MDRLLAFTKFNITIARDYDVRERIPYTCPSSYEIFFQSTFVCVAILISTSYWSVRVTSFNLNSMADYNFPK